MPVEEELLGRCGKQKQESRQQAMQAKGQTVTGT